jgi:hypothetical protein
MKHQSTNVTLEILVRGKPVREYKHTDGYTYIEGRKDSEFELRIRNNTSKRILAVPSVDGLSVMDGKPASSDSTGYIVGSYSSITIPGWRLDDSEVAKFLFEDEKRSYAEATGEGGNQGVISVMVFEEKVKYPRPRPPYITPRPSPWDRPSSWDYYWYPYYDKYTVTFEGQDYSWNVNNLGLDTRIIGSNTTTTLGMSGGGTTTSNASVHDGAPMSFTADVIGAHKVSDNPEVNINFVQEADNGEENLGVGFGEAETHQVNTISFDRGECRGLVTLYYDHRKGLERRGIQVVNIPPKSRPNPFPGNDRGCVPPEGWTR